MVSVFVRLVLAINLALAVSAVVLPRQGVGITSPCKSDKDCNAGCCGFNTGKCAGGVVALDRDGGCGFGDPVPNANAAVAIGATGAAAAFSSKLAAQGAASTPPAAPAGAAPANSTPPPVAAPAAPQGTQFITGPCKSDAECASGCCNAKTAQCAARLVALEGAGCGFGSPSAGAGAKTPPPAATPPAGGAAAPPAAPPAPAAGGALPPNVGGPPFDPAGVKNVGNGKGGQFIGGQCLSGADCASGCCAGPSGICSGPGAQTQAGKTGCGFVAGGAAAAPPAAAVPPPAAAPAAPAAAADAPKGTQFITGACKTDADCASGCCGKNSGLCAARLVAQEGAGCGHQG